jgi:hypothetical protein
VNVDEMQKKLSQKATKEPEHHFENLSGLLCNAVWLRVAAHTVLQNRGSGTAGIDGMTTSNFLGDPDGYIRSLHESLKAKTPTIGSDLQGSARPVVVTLLDHCCGARPYKPIRLLR